MPQKTIKVSAIEENADLRSTLAAILKGTPGYACAGIYGPGKPALAALESNAPDVMLVGINQQSWRVAVVLQKGCF